jgi:hypothetical protein
LDHVLLDNIPDDGKLESSALASVLTAEEWAGSRLGHTDIRVDLNRLTWYATGNRISLAEDLARRSMPILIDSGMEKPQARTFDKNIKTWTMEHRGELVHAVLVLIRNWFCKGQPLSTRTKGSYERYMAVVGGILDAAGLSEGFGSDIEVTDDETTTTVKDVDAPMRRLVVAWEQGLGYKLVSTAQLMEYVPTGILTTAKDRQLQHLGKLLRDAAGKTIAGHRIEQVMEKDERSRPVARYKLVNVEREAKGLDS